MAKIEVLGKEISELIAAGEVIERPASIIKELIENSIDAGATIITVEIKNGGIKYIRISDNGCGIPMLEMPTAFLRHATSKISKEEDLNNILTLGFRGEALASIAAISRVEMTSKPKSEEFGGKFTIEGSEPMELEQVGCSHGTTIIIRDIFYNTPARLKFLKSNTTEGNYIANLVDKMALSHPDVSFRFIRDGKQELCTLGNGDLYSAIYNVYGGGFANSLMSVDYSSNGTTVKGYVNIPHKSRSNRVMQMFFVNGRYVKAPILTVALEEAFKNSIMIGKFPACVLMIDINPGAIDINVHPAKTEIKFSDERAVYDVLFFAVKNAVMCYNSQNTVKPQYKVVPTPVFVGNEASSPKETAVHENEASSAFTGVNKITFVSRGDESAHILQFNSSDADYTPPPIKLKMETVYTDPPKAESFSFLSSDSFKEAKKPENTQMQGIEDVTVDIKYIGEIFKTYIVVEIDNEVAVIDKHAAHERYIFEQIKEGRLKGSSQILLFPRKLQLSRDEIFALLENKETVEAMGFSFGSHSEAFVEITGIPSVIGEDDSESVLTEIAENLLSAKKDITPEVLDRLYATISCKSAIKANDKNEQAELLKIARLVLTDEKLQYCPHGRPTVIRYTKSSFEKLFNRT